jgi:hypothetical protein
MGLPDIISNSDEWQEPRASRVAFDPDQLREGAKSTGGQVGVLNRIWVPHPNGLSDPCASWRLRPARLALRRKGSGASSKSNGPHALPQIDSGFVQHLLRLYPTILRDVREQFQTQRTRACVLAGESLRN